MEAKPTEGQRKSNAGGSGVDSMVVVGGEVEGGERVVIDDI